MVGPLTKEDVAAVVPLSAGRAPVLALNFLGDSVSTPRNFYQFALLAGGRGASASRGASLPMADSMEWPSSRPANGAFALPPPSPTSCSHLGGAVLETQRYETAQVDFSDVIKQVLQVRVVKGEPPTHRTDAAFVFVAAGSAGVPRAKFCRS